MRCQREIIFIAAAVTVFAVFAPAPAVAGDSYNILYQFSKQEKADGEYPHGGLIFDTSGNLYGATFAGGANRGGTVFQLVPDGKGDWTEHVLYSFCSAAGCADGENPVDRLLFDANGNLYGVADLGGYANAGVVYQLKPGSNGTWTEDVLYSFCPVAGCADGQEPWAGLIFDSAGNLYGTTKKGGGTGHGVAFELSPGANGWTESVLYSFCALANCADGAQVQGGLIFDSKGDLYGTTYAGGAYTNSGCAGVGSTCGTVYELTPGANGNWTEQVLHSFNLQDGAGSETSLIFDASGNLYGTATRGGYGKGSVGVAFELSPGAGGAWSETVLHSFPGSNGYPLSPLTFDSAGNLDGSLNGHLGSGMGGVFELSPSNGGWKQTVLHTFNGSDGASPMGGLVLDREGNLYGTAHSGGTGGGGVVFEITP